MPLLLRKATAADADALTEIYLSAFSKDAISLLIFPRDRPSSAKFWHDSILEEITDPNAHFVCVYDSDMPSEAVVSYAKWNSPSSTPLTLPPDQQWPAGGDHALAHYFFGNLVGRHNKFMAGKKHWYLELLATRPEYQGRGAAGMLLRWGLQRADEEGTETWIDASPDGKPIYEHFGWREVDRLVVKLEGTGEGPLSEKEFVEVMMVRPVSGKSSP